MGMKSRRKGARGERELAKEYAVRGFDAARTPNSGGLQTKGDVVGVPGVHIEAKYKERLNLWECLKQTEDEAPDGCVPALHFRRNHTGWYVAVPLDDWLDLLEEARA